MIRKEFIQTRIENLDQYLSELEEFLEHHTDTEIKESTTFQRVLERVVQLVVDEALTINSHIVKYEELHTPDDYFSTFLILAKNEVISHDLAERIAPSVGMRNRLVHEYETVDIDKLLRGARKGARYYREYISQIGAFLEKRTREA
ncbi:MAG: DUF86 domain-containing protein [Candidatus Paceibacterota bacterium]